MSAIIVDLAEARRCRAFSGRSPSRSDFADGGALASDFTFWSGASGARYVHTIYPLAECPDLSDANVLLVRRGSSGRAEVVHVGVVEHGVASLNLAEIRHTAARLGANEVHVHLLGQCGAERSAIAHDLSGSDELAVTARH